MAVIKHIKIYNANYNAAVDYLTLQHDEYTCKPVYDAEGNKLMRKFFLLDGINCDPYTFGKECQATNEHYGKNREKRDIKAHHYIISFDPRDRDENGLTPEKAQELGMAFAKKNFPGHQTIVCTHPDGHNSAGNIHVHIVINSVRKLDVTKQDFMERDADTKAGYKHYVSDSFFYYLRQDVMTMCQENNLYQVDLLNPARVRVTDREYWAKRKGQAELDSQIKDDANKEFKTDNQILRDAIASVLTEAKSYDDFKAKLFEKYGIEVNESRGKINYLPVGRERPIRGRQLGTDFEKEHILEVIATNAKSLDIELHDEDNTTQPDVQLKATVKYHSSGIRLITNLEQCLKAQQNLYYAHKVKIGNLQQMASTLAFVKENNIGTVAELDKLLASTSQDVTAKRKALKSTEEKLTRINLLIKYTGQYLANKEVYRQYLSSSNKKSLREEHRAEIALYEAARKYLKENAPEQATDPATGKVKFKCPSIKALRSEKEKLQVLKNQQYEEYSYSRAKYKELQTVAANVYTMTDTPTKAKEQEKSGQSL